MTALTGQSRPDEQAGPRPLPWRRMAWVTWRQHRIALSGVAALLGALAIYLWLTGLQLHHTYASAAACHPASSFACADMVDNFNGTYNQTAQAIAVLLQAVPALIGAFAGAPVLARELETGTFRYTWTLGFGRWRWTLGKLVPLAVVIAAVTGAFSLLVSWYFQPFVAEGSLTPLASTLFDLRGVAFAGWTLTAFAIGALTGMLIRRVVPSIVATLAVYAGLAVAVGLFARAHYMTPLLARNVASLPGSAWIVSQQWYGRGGQPVSQDTLSQALSQGAPQLAGGKGGIPQSPVVNQYLFQHGYTQLISYQPVSRFWPFQWIEGGWLLVLSALLIAATIWLVRRRAT